MVITLNLGARFTSYLTGLTVDDILKEYPDNILQFDTKIVRLVAYAYSYIGAAGGALASGFLYWLYYGIADVAFIFGPVIIFFVGLWYLRRAILAQHFKLSTAEQEVI